ncbi:MAG: TRAP transporter small permease [Clostridia bacterium]
MEKFDKAVQTLTKGADILAGLGIFLVMLLMVSNILLKNIFKSPIVGTYEYVGFLTAVAVALALSHCAYIDFHISVGIFVDKMSDRRKAILETVTKGFIFIMMALFSYNIMGYASRVASAGQVSLTTQTPISIFIHITGIGLGLLALVVLLQAVSSLLKAVKHGA